MSTAKGLSQVSERDLERLYRALHRDLLPSPITRSALILVAFGDIEGHLDLLVGRDVASAKALVRAVLAERKSERGTGVRLSFMGPPAPGTRSRDLVNQVRELLASATKSIELVGLRLDDAALGDGLLRTVRAVSEGRDVHTTLVLAGHGVEAPHERARELLTQHLRGLRSLTAYVCVSSRLRARAVVVDQQRALVTTGELTACEEDGSVDVGVLLDDADYVRALGEEWQRLIATGAFEPLT